MAEVRWTVEDVSRTGLAATYNGSLSTENTYLVRNDGNVMLHAKKSGAGDCTLTVETPKTVSGLAVADLTVTVPATTGDVFIGPFPPGTFNDDGQDLNVTLSEVTGLTVAALKLGG